MSRVREVLKTRNATEKEMRRRKSEEVHNMRSYASFKAYILDKFKSVEKLLDTEEVEFVDIQISKNRLSDFSKMMMESDELAMFNIIQVKGNPDKFRVSRKYISI